MEMTSFSREAISDQKLLTRSELWEEARRRLRVRDRVHHKDWKVLILAGPDPGQEVNTILTIMHKAEIIAVDKDPSCVEAARLLGIKSIHVDLEDYSLSSHRHGKRRMVNPLISELGVFDAIHLDLCGGPTDANAWLIKTYMKCVRYSGVVIVTFSYGRDVVEFLDEIATEPDDAIDEMCKAGVDKRLAVRIQIMRGSVRGDCEFPYFIITYTGNKMPMCSFLFQPNEHSHGSGNRVIRFIKHNPGDYEDYVLDFDFLKSINCPLERLTEIRRRAVARKAVNTAMLNRIARQESAQISLQLA